MDARKIAVTGFLLILKHFKVQITMFGFKYLKAICFSSIEKKNYDAKGTLLFIVEFLMYV